MPAMNDEEIFAPAPDAAPAASDDELLAPASRPRAASADAGAGGWARRHRRALRGGGLAALALWFFWYPANRSELFYALPERTAVAAYVRGLASEDRALLRHPVFRHAARTFGADPDEILEDNSGLYWTLYWLTGENSVVGVVPEEGECAGLGGYLAGASYVGWKARALELLWRIKWVPGLGRLLTTEKGTRYMEFPHAHELYDNGIVLGLDIVDGVLVAVLAQDPDRVLELSERLSGGAKAWPHLAPCLEAGPTGGDPERSAEPWREVAKRHRVWIRPDALGPYAMDLRPCTIDLGSFADPGLDLALEIGRDAPDSAATHDGSPLPTLGDVPPPAGAFAGIPADAPFLFVAGTLPEGIAAELGDWAPPAGGGFAAAWMADRPYATRLSILEVPSLAFSLPADPAAGPIDAWWPAWFARLKAEADLGLRDRAPDPATRLVRSKALELLGKTPDADCAFATQVPATGRLDLGLGWGAYRTLAAARPADGAETLGGVVEAARRDHPDAFLVARADFARLSGAGRNLVALARLAGRTGIRLDPALDETLRQVALGFEAARGLGFVEAVAGAADPARRAGLAVRIRASGVPSLPTPPSNESVR